MFSPLKLYMQIKHFKNTIFLEITQFLKHNMSSIKTILKNMI